MKTRLGPLPELLAEKNIAPSELARLAELTTSSIIRWLEGKAKRITNEKLRMIAAALEVELGDLCAMTALQQDVQALLRIGADLDQLDVSLDTWRAPEGPDARRWAPTRDVAEAVVAKLSNLLERDFDLPAVNPPAPPKLRRPAQAARATDPSAAS